MKRYLLIFLCCICLIEICDNYCMASDTSTHKENSIKKNKVSRKSKSHRKSSSAIGYFHLTLGGDDFIVELKRNGLVECKNLYHLNGTYVYNDGVYILVHGSSYMDIGYVGIIYNSYYYKIVGDWQEAPTFWNYANDNSDIFSTSKLLSDGVLSFDKDTLTMRYCTEDGIKSISLSEIPSSDRIKVTWN